MIRTKLFSASFAVLCALPSVMAGQDGVLRVRPESKVVLEGSSNIVDWACRTNAFEATIAVDSGFVRPAFAGAAQPGSRVSVRIPVRSLKCGHNRMNQDLYRTLRATEHPDIEYELSSYSVITASPSGERFSAITYGDITVAGVTRRVEVPISAERWEGGARGRGTLTLRMTDFGVKPPVALLGTIRTKNQIEVTFEVLLDRTLVAALMRAPSPRPTLD